MAEAKNHMLEFHWVDKPPVQGHTGRRGYWPSFILRLKQKPGKWAATRTYNSVSGAKSAFYRLVEEYELDRDEWQWLVANEGNNPTPWLFLCYTPKEVEVADTAGVPSVADGSRQGGDSPSPDVGNGDDESVTWGTPAGIRFPSAGGAPTGDDDIVRVDSDHLSN